MTDSKRSERLERIVETLMEPFESMSPEEMREDLKVKGLDPDTVVKDVRTDFARIAKEHKQQALREAQAGYEAAVQRFTQRQSHIPNDVATMRMIYAQAAQAHPLTVQHRDLSGVPSDELRELLEQLDALGLLADQDL